MRLLTLGWMLCGISAAVAEVAPPAAFEPVAVYTTNNGSVPPPFHWSWTAALFADGRVEVTYCKGYEEVAPFCATETGELADAGQIGLITEAARNSGLLSRPAIEANPPMVGGGWASGVVYVGAEKAELIGQPRASDQPRVESVLAVLAAAIPADLVTRAEARAQAPEEP